ncbi:MAG TPA: ABC transporter ATP-binding protein [Acidimicrobiales bacterium]|nr:ABC transporter ATP-binding protein [Acidimicrobiales bacterium]
MTVVEKDPSRASAPSAPVLAARGVSCVYTQAGDVGVFGRKTVKVRAVDDVTVEIFPNETLAIVGESGCGKTTLARLLLGLMKPAGGAIEFRGKDIRKLSRQDQEKFHKAVQVVFQDPLSSLNPRMQVHRIIGDIVRLWGGKLAPSAFNHRVQQILREVELTPPRLFLERFPHELSGGQRQRVAIAKAITVEPDLIVADEPLSALDVSVQGQILDLLRRLKEEFGVGYVLISHDLEVVRSVADRVVVMYLGKVVESGTVDEVFESPRHPYTRSLLGSVLRADPRAAKQRERTLISGEVPSLASVPSGCRFHPRCPVAVDRCSVEVPVDFKVSGTHVALCHRVGEAGVVEQIEVPVY